MSTLDQLETSNAQSNTRSLIEVLQPDFFLQQPPIAHCPFRNWVTFIKTTK
jgi:hypothetical protein